jgi:hypothetical protein
MNVNTRLLASIIVMIFSAVLPPLLQGQQRITALRFLDEYIIPFDLRVHNTSIGGLSGIDYDKKQDLYYILSDDRSVINPARFYTARIRITGTRIDTVLFESVHLLQQPDRSPYASGKESPGNAPDPESIRYHAPSGTIYWANEGERLVDAKRTLLRDPSITRVTRAGEFIDSLTLPARLKVSKEEYGTRRNAAIEGLAFSPDQTKLYFCTEEPLYQDGPRATTNANDGWIRIFSYDVKSNDHLKQFAYKPERVAHAPVVDGAFTINGISEILALNNRELLIVERSYSTGRFTCTVKVYLADLRTAQDIARRESLISHPPARPVTKKLLLDMDELGIAIDNIEGVTFGPTLPNGSATLIFVSDNNFQRHQKTQVLLFEVVAM